MAKRTALGHFSWSQTLSNRVLFSFALLIAAACTVACGQETKVPAESEEVSPFDGLVFYCTKCMKEVPEQLGAGSKCPHCGAFFESATNADGSETQVAPVATGISLRVWAAIALVLLFGGEYLVRRWRRGRAVSWPKRSP